MATSEQQAYELLARTDHPVFARDFSSSTTADSPFNSIMNRVVADQIQKVRSDQEIIKANRYPNTATLEGIDQWEETYFGFTKDGEDLDTRVAELVARVNQKLHMSVPDVIAVSQVITGVTPTVIRNLVNYGWILDESVLDYGTILGGPVLDVDGSIYAVVFTDPVDSNLLKKLDNELTKIEKAGSRHAIIAPTKYWTLDDSSLDVDSVLG